MLAVFSGYFAGRQSALQQKTTTRKQILPFVTTYQPSVCNLKSILMQNWHIIQNQPLLNAIFKNPPILSHRRGKSLTDMLVKAKLWRLHTFTVKSRRESVQACRQSLFAICSIYRLRMQRKCCPRWKQTTRETLSKRGKLERIVNRVSLKTHVPSLVQVWWVNSWRVTKIPVVPHPR